MLGKTMRLRPMNSTLCHSGWKRASELMPLQQEEEQLLTCYFLGELSAEEEEELEERLWLDSELFERMLAHRDHLIDDYLGGKLSPLQQQHFKNHFMATTEQRERVQMAQALLDVLAAEREVKDLTSKQQAATPTIALRHQPEQIS